MPVYVASDWTDAADATLAVNDWWLTDPTVEGSGLAVSVHRNWKPTTRQEAGVFYPEGSEDQRAIVVHGDSYGIESGLALWTLDRATFDAVKALLLSKVTLLLRNPWGDAYYLAVTSGVSEDPEVAAAIDGEPWPIRHAHALSCNVVEVAAP